MVRIVTVDKTFSSSIKALAKGYAEYIKIKRSAWLPNTAPLRAGQTYSQRQPEK
jgi:hypothetical protein